MGAVLLLPFSVPSSSTSNIYLMATKTADSSFQQLKRESQQRISQLFEEIKIGAEHGHTSFLSFHEKFQAINDDNALTLRPTHLRFEFSEHTKDAKVKQTQLGREHEDAGTKQSQATSALAGRNAPYCLLGLVALAVSTVAICLIEGLLAIPVFMSFNFTQLESLVLGCLFSLALYLFIPAIPAIIAFGSTALQRKIIAISLFVFTVAFFYFLSTYRAEFFANASSEDSDLPGKELNPWGFTCISTFFLLVGASIDFFLMPSKADQQEMKEYRKLRKAKRRVDKAVTETQKKIDALNTETRTLTNTNKGTYLDGNSLEEYVISSAKQGYSKFQHYSNRTQKEADQSQSLQADYPYQFTIHFPLHA
jgi:hypothetical protein